MCDYTLDAACVPDEKDRERERQRERERERVARALFEKLAEGKQIVVVPSLGYA